MNTRKNSSFGDQKPYKKFSKGPRKFSDTSKTKKPRIKNYSIDEEDVKNAQKITGLYSQASQNDFGFIDVEGQEKGFFVYPKNLNGALDGDEVEAYVKVFNRRKEAVITKIIKRADRVLVGKIELVKDFAFVVLDNIAFKKDVYLSSKKLTKYKDQLKSGDKVAIKITRWEGKNPEGMIFEVLGDEKTQGVDIMALALEGGARIKFPYGVTQEASELHFSVGEGRIDLSNTLTFTIDGEDAKDLDDAISIETITHNSKNIPLNAKNAMYRLIVSIADVAEYVKDGSELDKEAFKRGNSIYLVDRVIPMLPEKLSNDLCSLNPHTKKLTLSCEMFLDSEGNVVDKKVYESVIVSDARLTYKEVQEMVDGEKSIGSELMFGGSISQDLFEAVKMLEDLRNRVSTRKKKTGILDFDFPETKIILDEVGFPVDIKKYERYNSMKIIEECMVLANESVGELFSKIPFLYRIHPVPGDDDIEKLRTNLAIFGVILPYKKMTSKVIAEVLDQIKNSQSEKLLSKLVLRSLEKAIYSEKNEGHFGLGLDFYSHFTSPIRRYPDLQIHRIMKDQIHGKMLPAQRNFYEHNLPKIAKHTSDTERKAEKLEYTVRDLMICKFYQDKVGQQFQGMVSGMIAAGIFVELENTAEGFVSFESIAQKYKIVGFDFDEEHLKVTFKNQLSLQVGESIEITLEEVDMERRRLNFSFIEKK